ncbi:MAG: hypothetical protein ACOCWA_04265 [Bacteroidota bacterium]
MKDLCVPIPNFGDQQFAEIEIKVGKKRTNLNYRVVSFPWEEEDDFSKNADELELSLVRIYRLKKAIEGYDRGWELIQIYNPSENASHIQVLYRKK